MSFQTYSITPIAIAKIKLGDDTEEIKIYEGDDVMSKAQEFCENFELPEQCVNIIKEKIEESLALALLQNRKNASHINQNKSPLKNSITSRISQNKEKSKTPERMRIPISVLKKVGVAFDSIQKPPKPIPYPSKDKHDFTNIPCFTEPNESVENESFNNSSISTMKSSMGSGKKKEVKNPFEAILAKNKTPSKTSFQRKLFQNEIEHKTHSPLSFSKQLQNNEKPLTPRKKVNDEMKKYKNIHSRKGDFQDSSNRLISPSNSRLTIKPKSSIQQSPIRNEMQSFNKSPMKNDLKTSLTPNKRYRQTIESPVPVKSINLSINSPNSTIKQKTSLCGEGVIELFKLFDSDCDGFIDPINIDLSGIKFEILENLEEILLEIDQRGTPLNMLQLNKMVIVKGFSEFVKENFGKQTHKNSPNFPQPETNRKYC